MAYPFAAQREGARCIFESFLAGLKPESTCFVLGHSDADGLTSAVLIARILEGKGFRTHLGTTVKGENAWTPAVLERIHAMSAQALIVCDLGSRSEPLLPDLPTLLIDHHQPTGVPPNAMLLSGYDSDPVPTSGLLASWCAPAGMAGLDWLPAVSLLADLGARNPFPELALATKRYGSATLREVTTLVNAPRRVGAGDASVALDLLAGTESPHAFLANPRIALLRHAKEEFDAALAQARRVAPKFSGNVAVIQVETTAQVHPMVAQSWLGRLRKNIVICANTGFLPGRVNFAVRTALSLNLLDFLAEHRPEGTGGDYGRGHKAATGVSLTVEQWLSFLRNLGFTGK